MDFITTFKLSIKEILSNKLRSILTMLGVIIGVYSVIVMVSIGEGVSSDIKKRFEKNSNMIMIYLYPDDRNKLMRYEDNKNYFLGFDHVDGVIADMNYKVTAKGGSVEKKVKLMGADKVTLKTVEEKLTSGRFISDMDVSKGLKNAVINNKFKDTYFKNESPIGKTIRFDGVNYNIIGVMEDREGNNWDVVKEEAYIPITTALRATGNDRISQVKLLIDKKENVIEASGIIEKELNIKYPKKKTDEDTPWAGEQFYVSTPQAQLKEVNQITGTFTLMLGGIAGISLLVGGIGIMNIMFVSVTERTREIGIRKAIGAKRRDILMQFLLESGVISSIGGIIGIVLAIVTAALITKYAPIQAIVSSKIVLLGFSFSFAIGVIFGIYPANKASKLNPIDALRYE